MVDRRVAGRPRSERSRMAILQAAVELLQADGYESLSIDAIAQRAGVGRQTIYRWWSGKASILAEAAQEDLVSFGAPLSPDLAIDELLNAWARELQQPYSAAALLGLTAAAAGDRTDSDALYAHITRGSHRQLQEALRAGQRGGTIRADIDVGVCADALLGAFLYRMLIRLPLTADFVPSLLAPIRA